MSGAYVAVLIALLLANHVFVLLLPPAYRALGKRSEERQIYALKASPAQLRREWLSSLVTTPIPPLIIGVSVHVGLLNVHPAGESWGSAALTFVAVFVWSEIWHYYSHVAMHHRRLMWIHRHHHLSRPPVPLSCLSFSIVEKTLLSCGILAPLWIASQTITVSFYGIAAYYLLYFFTNAVGHYNVEFFNVGHGRTLGGRVFTTSTYHVMHHARFNGHYGLMTSLLDRLHGTAWRDYDAVLDRAASGRPLSRLGERLEPLDTA